MREARVPGFPSDLGIGDVVVDVGELLRLRVLRPQSLRAAKIRNPGLGGDAGAREDHDARGALDPRADGGDGRFKETHLPGTRKTRTHAQRAMRSASTAPTPNNRRPSI